MPRISDNIRYLYFYNFLDRFIFFFPVRILFFVEVTGNLTLSMTLFALQDIAGVLFQLPAGYISDKWGRTWACRLSSFCSVCAAGLYAVSYNYATLLLASAFYGFYNSLSSTGRNALLYETASQTGRKKEYHKLVSKVFSLRQTSLGLSSLAGAAIIFISLRAVMAATVFPAICALVLAFMLREPKRRTKKTYQNIFAHALAAIKSIKRNRRLKLLTLADAMHYGFNESAFNLNAVFFKQFVPEWAIGIFRSLANFATAAGSHFSSFFLRKFDVTKTGFIGAYLDNALNILMVLISNAFSPVIKIVVAFFGGIKDPAFNLIIQNECKNKDRGMILSLMSLSNSLSYSICAVAIGIIADHSSPYAAMLTMYVLALASNPLFFFALRQKKVQPPTPAGMTEVITKAPTDRHFIS